MWPYPWTHVGTPSHLGHMDRVAATMPAQAHAGAAQEAPDMGQWEGQDIPLVRPSSCNVKGGIPSSRRYLPTYLPTSPGFHEEPLRRSAVAAPGVQGHLCLARVGDPVDGLLDVHAAARGLIQDPAPRHPVAQGGACGCVSHCGQRPDILAGSGLFLGAPVFSGAVAPVPSGAEGGHAARRRRGFRGRAARGGPWAHLQVGIRIRVLLGGGPRLRLGVTAP